MSDKPKTRTLHGVWQACDCCGQFLPCDPELDMCGACTFGEADMLMAFDGEYEALDGEDVDAS